MITLIIFPNPTTNLKNNQFIKEFKATGFKKGDGVSIVYVAGSVKMDMRSISEI